jgi:hypothetical protein
MGYQSEREKWTFETGTKPSNVNRFQKSLMSHCSLIPHCIRPSLANETGYTLILVLVLISVVGILFSSVIKELGSVNLTTTREIQRIQARLLAESGIKRTEYFLSGGEGHTILWESQGCDEFLQMFGTIHLECYRFGLFAKIFSQGTRNRTTNSITAIIGRTPPECCNPVLTLTGKVGGLALMSNSLIKGDVILSRGRVCRGESLEDVKDNNLHLVVKSLPTLPFDSSQAISVVKELADKFKEACTMKSTVTGNVTLSSENDIIVESDELIVAGDCRIDKGTYNEKTICASGTILLTGEARCTACKLYAKRVVIDGGVADKCVFFSKEIMRINGGSYNSQAFCTDSMLITEKVRFGPMSLLMLLREGIADSTASICFSTNVNICGVIICYSDSIARNHSPVPSVIFGKDCVLNGICMTDGDLYMKDITVRGHLWGRSIVASDGKKSYVNYCFNMHIEEPLVELVFPLVGIPPVSLVIEKISDEYTVKNKPAEQQVPVP